MIYEAGRHELPTQTKYLGVGVRIKVFNPSDKDEVNLINQLQDQILIVAASADSLPPFPWDLRSLQAVTNLHEKESVPFNSWKGMMGSGGKVDGTTRHIAAAAAWGLFPGWDATYLNTSINHDPDVPRKATYQVPENNAFWSITLYGRDGFMKSENCIINSANVNLNDDGTFTIWYGPKQLCAKAPNQLGVTEGWTSLMRIHRPGPSALRGSCQLPAAEPADYQLTTTRPPADHHGGPCITGQLWRH